MKTTPALTNVLLLPDEARENGDGYDLNIPGILKVAYATRLQDLKPGAPRERMRRLQERVNNYANARFALTGVPVDLMDAIGAVVDVPRFTRLLKSGNPDAAYDLLLGRTESTAN